MEKTQLLESWDEIVAELEPEERAFVGKTPIFRSDKDVLPLQAGDIIAWLERNRWESMKGISQVYVPPWDEPEKPVDGLTFVYDEGAIKRVLVIAHEKALRETSGGHQ